MRATEASRNRNRYLRRSTSMTEERGAVDGEDVPDEAVVREVLVEALAPPLRMRPRVARGWEVALRVVDVLVDRDSVVQPAVEEDQRDVVVHLEVVRGGQVRATTRQVQTVGIPFVAVVDLRVVERVEPHHALVDVVRGVVHDVVVEPEEALL